MLVALIIISNSGISPQSTILISLKEFFKLSALTLVLLLIIISEELINDYNVNSNNTEIKLIANCKSIVLNIDSFQISNAINNLIDNAVKYGGDEIIVELFRNEEKTLIKISDSGTILEQKHKNLIFEKFYNHSFE